MYGKVGKLSAIKCQKNVAMTNDKLSSLLMNWKNLVSLTCVLLNVDMMMKNLTSDHQKRMLDLYKIFNAPMKNLTLSFCDLFELCENHDFSENK